MLCPIWVVADRTLSRMLIARRTPGISLRALVTTGALIFLGVLGIIPGPVPPAAATPPNGFKSVGYLPSWAGDVDAIPYDTLTHINYAFVFPGPDGSLPDAGNPAKLRALVSRSHARGVQVLISIGGWNNGNDAAFEQLAANPASRSALVANATSLVQRYGLDGVDVDWEYPDPGSSAANFTLLMRELSAAMHSRGKLLTAAVVSGGATARGVEPAVFDLVDFLNIMLYDGGSPHANVDWAVAGATEWKARGLPAAKAVIGVPFFSRPGNLSFAQLFAADGSNADRDCTVVQGTERCYNGRQTIRRKTQWAMANAGGLMNWELSNDTAGWSSLLGAMAETAAGTGSAGPLVGIAGKCLDVLWGRADNGAPIQLWACNGTNAQWWTLDPAGAVRANGRCLDVPGGSTASGSPLQLWDCNGTGAQVWQPQGDGSLRNPQSGKCLDVPGWTTADGVRLQLYDCHGSVNQFWRQDRPVTFGGPAGPITGLAGKCMDVWSGLFADGAAVQLYGCNGTAAQRWTVNPGGSLRALGKCLDVPGGLTANGMKLQLWECNGTGAQVWRARGDGTVLNPQSGRCIDVTDRNPADGTRLQIWDCQGASIPGVGNQNWRLP